MAEFDVSRAIPVSDAGERQPAFDVSRAVPVAEKAPPTLGEIGGILLRNLKETPGRMLEQFGKDMAVIRWPFWRFIEHPTATITEALQEPEGKTVGGTLARAAQAYVPFRQIPREEYGTYGKVWDNYYQSAAKLKGYAPGEVQTPDWYIAMASYGSAMAVEPPMIRAGNALAETAVTRVATVDEAAAVRAHFEPLKTSLQTRGLKVEDLHPEGNIIKITPESELFINKYVSAVLRGDEIRIPRWSKVNMPTVPAIAGPSGTPGTPAVRPPEVFPSTGPEVLLAPEAVTAPSAAGDFYARNRVIKKTQPGMEVAKSAEEFFTPISSRLERIAPELKTALRKFEFDLGQQIMKDNEAAVPLLQSMSTMDKGDLADLDLALKNGDIVKIDEVVNKYGLQQPMASVRQALNDVHRRANEVGIDFGYIENYFPRIIKDPKGFVEYVRGQDYWSGIQEAIDKKEMQLGRYLTDEEKATAINSLLRGYSVGDIKLEKPGNFKGRTIDTVTPELNAFYAPSNDALVRYIESVNNQIEAKRFFGQASKADGDSGVVDIENSIGAYTLRLLAEGKIKPSQELELRDILKARFTARGMHGFLAAYRNLAYIDTMGSPISAITQISDLAWSLYQSGFYRTGKSILNSLAGKSEITKKDIGIDRIAEEFADSSKSAKAVQKVFKMVGIDKMDNLGKETLINSALSRLRQEAKNPSQKLRNQLEVIFGDEAGQVLTDLQSGGISENIKMLLFSELMDFQPVALSEMPEKYLTGGNGRIFYMLKSFTLKQIDIFRREAFDKMAKGNVKEGLGNLIRLAALFMLANGTGSLLKDIVLNREIDLDDIVLDNILMAAGFSKFQIYKAKEEGIRSAIGTTMLPPMKFPDSVIKDISSIVAYINDEDKPFDLKDVETAQSIPLVGKLYYWWFGKGREKEEKKRESE